MQTIESKFGKVRVSLTSELLQTDSKIVDFAPDHLKQEAQDLLDRYGKPTDISYPLAKVVDFVAGDEAHHFEGECLGVRDPSDDYGYPMYQNWRKVLAFRARLAKAMKKARWSK